MKHSPVVGALLLHRRLYLGVDLRSLGCRTPCQLLDRATLLGRCWTTKLLRSAEGKDVVAASTLCQIVTAPGAISLFYFTGIGVQPTNCDAYARCEWLPRPSPLFIVKRQAIHLRGGWWLPLNRSPSKHVPACYA